MIVPVILCGGSGTRLWPLSRELYPKQLLSLVGTDTLLQQTAKRLSGLTDATAPVVICNEEHRFMVAEQLRAAGLRHQAIILEPVGRNTAPAVALAALYALDLDPDSVLLVLPADHLIQQPESFYEAVEYGQPFAMSGRLVTFGIVPDRPETGYGYIKCGAVAKNDGPDDGGDDCRCQAYCIERFVEKPDLELAKRYVASGDYHWNSGMFLFRSDVYLEELSNNNRQIVEACAKAYEKASEDLDFLRVERESFCACPSDSIDYAVMEKSDRGIVIPADLGWSDIGSWSALWDVGERDGNGNIVVGDVLLHESTDSYFHASTRLIAGVGVRDHVVVETADAVLVAHKSRVQDVKKVVEQLKRSGRSEANLHRRVFRPWGSYEGLSDGERFQVKHIIVKPGCSLSLQMHHHRAEHWIVVRGTAKITRGDETFMLSENESTYIPLGVRHRLENPGIIPLELIEVQSGAYLGEDDIVRFEDDYGRIEE